MVKEYIKSNHYVTQKELMNDCPIIWKDYINLFVKHMDKFEDNSVPDIILFTGWCADSCHIAYTLKGTNPYETIDTVFIISRNKTGLNYKIQMLCYNNFSLIEKTTLYEVNEEHTLDEIEFILDCFFDVK